MRARLFALMAMLFASPFLFAQTPGATGSTGPHSGAEPEPIHWQDGPITAKLGAVAQINVPKGYMFADGNEARKLNDRQGNPSTGQEVGVITPTGESEADNWYVFFDYDPSGHVDDAGGSDIDAQAMLDSVKQSTEEDNDIRRKKGWTPFHVMRWDTRPFYDPATHNLTWSFVGYADDKDHSESLNYSSRILGRSGVMHTDLVGDPSQKAAVTAFNELIKGYHYTDGSRYTDFKAGDKVATYGLTALIAGGAAAAVVKTGILAKLLGLLAAAWKPIALAFAALLSRFKSIWAALKRRFTRTSEDS